MEVPLRARKQCHLGIFFGLLALSMPLHFVALASEAVLLWKKANKIQTVKEALGFYAVGIAEKCVFSLKLCHQLPASPQANLPFDLSPL